MRMGRTRKGVQPRPISNLGPDAGLGALSSYCDHRSSITIFVTQTDTRRSVTLGTNLKLEAYLKVQVHISAPWQLLHSKCGPKADIIRHLSTSKTACQWSGQKPGMFLHDQGTALVLTFQGLLSRIACSHGVPLVSETTAIFVYLFYPFLEVLTSWHSSDPLLGRLICAQVKARHCQ